MPDQITRHLLEVLTKERIAIRAADFQGLDKLVAEKTRLMEALPNSTGTKSDLAQIKEKLDANQALLRAAIAGVAAAQDRIAAVRNVREGLSVYDQSGQLANVSTGRPDLEKKA